MKRFFSLLFASLLVLTLCSCSGGDSSGQEGTDGSETQLSAPSQFASSHYVPTSSQDSQPFEESSMELSAESVDKDVSEEEEETSADYILPNGLTKVSGGRLRFTTSVLSLSATFPEQFHVLNADYTPAYGIYLRNESGSATLLIESVEDKTMTHKEMAQYLRSEYPDATVTVSDKKEVVCTMSLTDTCGNPLYLQQKMKMKNGGYNLISLCCHPDEKSTYTSLFHEIEFQ